MDRDWNLSRVRRALLTVALAMALVATITQEHLMAYGLTVLGLVVVMTALALVEGLGRDRRAPENARETRPR